MSGFAAGLALCGVVVGADYGSTLSFQQAARARGYEINEVGPVARHGLPIGAAVKGAGCVAGEVILRNHPKQRRVFRVVGLALAGGLVASHLIQQRQLEKEGR